MILAYDAKRLFHNFTGLGNYSRTLVEDLSRFFPQHQYHLFTPRPSTHPRTQKFRQPPFQVHTATTWPAAYWRTSAIKKDLKQHRVDLFHGLSHEIPLGIHKTGIKSVVSIHDLVIKHYPHLFPWIDRQIYEQKFRYACQHADRVIAISESTRQDIIRFYNTDPAKVEVIYQTCAAHFKQVVSTQETQQARERYQLPAHYLLYVGSIIERKNLLPLVQALARFPLDQQMPLVVLGKGKAYRKKVVRWIQQNGMSRSVFFPEGVDFLDFPAIYRGATALVYPSTYEGFGIPIIEALFCQTPVLTTNTSSLPEAGGPGAHYIEEPTVDALQAGIEKLLSSQDYARTLALAGHQYVQRFRSQPLSEQLMRCYEKTLKTTK